MAPLETLLDQAAEALLAGDFGVLAHLTPQIESANAVAEDRISADRLRAKAERNAKLLEAATRGVKAAQIRVLDITRGPTLSTYDARGQRAVIPALGTEPARRV